MFHVFGEGYLPLENIFVFKYSQTVFYSVSMWNIYGKSVIRTYLGTFFKAPIPFKQYQNTSGCGTALTFIVYRNNLIQVADTR